MTLPRVLLVATDFSTFADHACQVAIDWAERFEGEVHFAHGVECLPKDTPPSALPLLTGYVERARKVANQKLAEWVSRAEQRGVTASGHIVDSPAAEGVVELAEALQPDCVVVGTHGHTGLRRALLGSVAERIVRAAPGRVLVVRAGRSPFAGTRVVFGDDLSAVSSQAREDAVELAGSLGTGLDVIHALDLGIPYLSTLELLLPDALFEDLYAEPREALDKAAREAPDLAIESHVVGERPAGALCSHAEGTDAGLIVVGSHGRRGLERGMLGSVAEQVVRHAPCSVLISR